MRRGAFVALVAAATLIAAGCGSSSHALTRTQLANRAEAICKRLNRETLALYRSISAGHDVQDPTLARVVEEVAARQRQAVAQLDALEPPSGVAARYDQFNAAMQAVVRMQRPAEALIGGDDPQLQSRGLQMGKALRLAKDIGIPHCPS
jgi:hypothetical protein